MSGIVLSSSVRQNLLSLQSTADLLATTQSRLSTGKKVNTALDNPTNFFTAQSLDNRSSDINNLLDGISNGVQVIQAANTGLTSLQKLVDSAKSVANQALQAAVGYSTKSSITTAANAGATAADLRGTGTGYTSAASVGIAATSTSTTAYTNTAATAGSQLYSASATAATGSTLLSGLTDVGGVAAGIANNDTLTVNGKTITFQTGAGALTGTGNAYTLGIGTSLSTLVSAIDTLQGSTSAAPTTGIITLNTGTAANLAVTGSSGVLAKLGLGAAAANTATRGGGVVSTPALAGSTKLGATAPGGGAALSTAFQANDTLTINGQTLTFKASGATGANEIDVTADVTALLGKIDGLSGGTGSSISGGVITLNTATTSDLSITSSRAGTLAALGLGNSVSQARGGAAPTLDGLTLSIGATGGGTAINITFGDGTAGTVKSLNDLNAKLSTNNLQATIDSGGAISITTTNDAASFTIGTISGTAAGTGKAFAAFNNTTGPVAVKDAAAQLVRSNLVTQYNNILDQITTTSQDASYNGVNLLNNDALKLTFNEIGTSTLKIQGVQFNATGLGLSKLTDFNDNSSATAAISTLSNASSTLRTQASTLGSNLSIVQIRQDFSKNLINVLQTGSSNLTLADTNEEAANSQALSTRQSIAVSALALANTSQQSVLQLLR
jgi:hypothetical protein